MNKNPTTEGLAASTVENAVRQNFMNEAELLAQMKHPILCKKIVLPTKPISELVSALRRVVMLREQGCCFSATSGYGKSWGLAMAETELRSLFPAVPIFRHIIPNHPVPSIRAFFKHFLCTVGIKDLKGETYDLRMRLVNRLIDYGRTSPLKLIVILIDEAQEMAVQDFKFLKDIGNEMEKMDVQLVVIMMGQDPEFGEAISDLRADGRLDLVSRFALRQLKFRGLYTTEDFEAVLGLIDRQCYPTTSSCTWPQYFAPRFWGAGFRMMSQAGPLMQAIRKHTPEALEEKGTPARQLFLAIRRFMIDLADVDRSGKDMPGNLWDTAIEYALIEDATMIACNAAPKRTRRKKVTA